MSKKVVTAANKSIEANTSTEANKGGRPKVNPDYDPVAARDKMAKVVAELYLHPSSNMDTDEEGHATMKELQDHFGLTMTKIRKLLVTAGVYHFYKDDVDMVEAVQKLSKEGKSLEEIKDILHISTGTANSFLPYKSGTYNADFTADDYDFSNVSVDARRKRNQRKREKMKDPKAIYTRENNIMEMQSAMDKQKYLGMSDEEITAEKARRRAENEAKHQAKLKRKKDYHERKEQRERDDPGGFLREIKFAREIGSEGSARESERARDLYLRRQAGEVIPERVGHVYVYNDPLPQYWSSGYWNVDLTDEERKLLKELQAHTVYGLTGRPRGFNNRANERTYDNDVVLLPIKITDETLAEELTKLLFALTDKHEGKFLKKENVAAFDVLFADVIEKLDLYYHNNVRERGRMAGYKLINVLKGVGTDDDMFPEYEIKMVQDAIKELWG